MLVLKRTYSNNSFFCSSGSILYAYKKCFSPEYEDGMLHVTFVFIFPFANVVYCISLFMLDHPCIPDTNPTWL